MCLNHYKEKTERSPSTEVTSCVYFTTLHGVSRFSPGPFWCMSITLRVHALCTHGVIVKNHTRLKTLLKKFAVDHMKKKSNVLTFGEIKEGLTSLINKTSNKDLMHVEGKHC